VTIDTEVEGRLIIRVHPYLEPNIVLTRFEGITLSTVAPRDRSLARNLKPAAIT